MFDAPATSRIYHRRRAGIKIRHILIAVSVIFVVLPLLAMAWPAAAGESRAGEGSGKVLFVVIDRIGLDDLTSIELPYIDGLAMGGAVGLMNARVRYNPWGAGNYVVIGAGGRALGTSNASLAFDSDELLEAAHGEPFPAADIYQSRTGNPAPGKGVVNISIEEMKRRSEGRLADSTPGLLGDTLDKAGVRRYVLGNADIYYPTTTSPPPQTLTAVPPEQASEAEEPLPPVSRLHREVSCILMDEDGKVPEGDVSISPIVDRNSVAGVNTDFPQLVEKASDALAVNDVVVVDLGQTSRLDAYRQFVTNARLEEIRRQALKECDEAVGSLTEDLDLRRDTVIICTPTPTRQMIRDGEFTTPLVIAGRGVGQGVLTSSTTRRKGLVSIYDIAPTVLECLGLETPGEMSGASIYTVSEPLKEDALVSLRNKMLVTHTTRDALVRVFVITASVILLLLLLVSLLRKDLILGHPYFTSIILLSVIAGPLAYLLLPLFNCRYLYCSIPVAVGLQLLLGTLSLLIPVVIKGSPKSSRDRAMRERGSIGGALRVFLPRGLLVLSGVTLILVLLDPVLDSPLMPFSPFGSDMMLGGRYYGIGNTYMGVAIGAAILVVALLPEVFPAILDRGWRIITAATGVLLVTIIVLGYPRLGANVGGLITGVLASLFVLMKLAGQRIGWKQVVAVVLLAAICVGVLLVIDLALPGSVSHAGRTFERIRERGVAEAFAVVSRKVSQNWALVFASIWRIFFFLGVIVALIWRWRPGIYREVSKSFPHVPAAWTGLIIAMVIALLFNDTGIESAGALMIFFILPSFLLFLPEWLTGFSKRPLLRE